MRKLSAVLIFVLVFAMFGQVSLNEANAAGVTAYADLAADGNYNGAVAGGLTDMGTTTSEAEIATGGSADVYFSFLADTSEFDATDSVTITLPVGYTAAGCTASTTDADADQVIDGSLSYGGNLAIYTFTASTTLATSTGVEFCVNVTTAGVAGNDVVTITSSSTVPQTASVFIYNGNANEVVITAIVQDTLFFQIRTAIDDTTTNVCDLGVLDTGSVKECQYRLAIETAAANGFTAYLEDDNDTGLYNGSTELTRVTEDQVVTAGQEGYGIAFEGATSTLLSTVTEEGDYNDDDTSIPDDKTAILSANAPYDWQFGTTTTSSLVTHRAAIDATTPSGSYTQTVSYYVTGNY